MADQTVSAVEEETSGLALRPEHGSTDNVQDDDLEKDLPSPGVDVHALFGIPKAKRSSEKSDVQEEIEDTDSYDNLSDSDDEEEFQEGEYILVDDSEEFSEIKTEVLAEEAGFHRQALLPVFRACTPAYERWIEENKGIVPEEELAARMSQLKLYRKVLVLYGTDAEWSALSHDQQVERDNEALQVSQEAKAMGQLPEVVAEASMAAARRPSDESSAPDSVQEQ